MSHGAGGLFVDADALLVYILNVGGGSWDPLQWLKDAITSMWEAARWEQTLFIEGGWMGRYHPLGLAHTTDVLLFDRRQCSAYMSNH